MGGIPEQSRAAEGPTGHRVAVDHREEVGPRRRPEDRGHVEPIEHPVLEIGQEIRELAGSVPILRLSEPGLGAAKLRNEVQRLTAVREVGDRIGNELLIAMTGPDHRAPVQQWLDLADASPEERAIPAGWAL